MPVGKVKESLTIGTQLSSTKLLSKSYKVIEKSLRSDKRNMKLVARQG